MGKSGWYLYAGLALGAYVLYRIAIAPTSAHMNKPTEQGG